LTTKVHQIDPLTDPRWTELVNAHHSASIFHTAQWLRAIQASYGYRPVVFTTEGPGEKLKNGVVFCVVQSWLTGRRLVSVPFSDHCEPLISEKDCFQEIMATVRNHCSAKDYKYVELRPMGSDNCGNRLLPPWEQYYFHVIDLRPDLDTIFSQFQKSSIQRKIKKAEREDLLYEEGHSPELLDKFYNLMQLTRRKHQVPPQPREWFGNIAASVGDRMKVRVVSKDGRPAASILTMVFKETMVYKYGCSDLEMSSLGGTPLLFWRAIQDAKELGITSLDLGRSNMDNEGLLSFKEKLGGQRSTLTYFRYPEKVAHHKPSFQMRMAKQVFSHMPETVQTVAGRLLYRHIG
jgi:hypothetical protein